MALDVRPSLFLLLTMTRSSSQSGSDVIYVDLSVSAVSLMASVSAAFHGAPCAKS